MTSGRDFPRTRAAFLQVMNEKGSLKKLEGFPGNEGETRELGMINMASRKL